MKTGKQNQITNQNLKRYKIGLIFGTFDCLHYGHIRLFIRAKAVCNKLIVITEDDKTIETEKHKPFTTSEERIEYLKSIKYIDKVYLRTGKKDRRFWAEKLRPDVMFLGSDWKDKDWEGKHFGIPIIYLERTKDINSTILREWEKNTIHTYKQTGRMTDTE